MDVEPPGQIFVGRFLQRNNIFLFFSLSLSLLYFLCTVTQLQRCTCTRAKHAIWEQNTSGQAVVTYRSRWACKILSRLFRRWDRCSNIAKSSNITRVDRRWSSDFCRSTTHTLLRVFALYLADSRLVPSRPFLQQRYRCAIFRYLVSPLCTLNRILLLLD